jgi:hypothetical protein
MIETKCSNLTMVGMKDFIAIKVKAPLTFIF